MRFIDEARLQVVSGHGGAGCASFRREKFVAMGGPDGGDGGRGGAIVMVASHRRNTLLDLRGHSIWRADSGRPGSGKQRNGRCAEDTIIEVPVGTRVIDDLTGDLIADLVDNEQSVVVAPGGQGGLGNIHFKTSTNRSPRKSSPGGDSVERRLRLELLLMADVGLLGFPNAGKSTLISRISSARPRVADYPFTTLVPNLGVVDMGLAGSFVVADVPGLIQGAADGAGLGHRFLRHVQRTRLLLHLVSLGSHEQELPASLSQTEAHDASPAQLAVARYRAIRSELAAYDDGLAARPELVVLTKSDIATDEEQQEALSALSAEVDPDRIMLISAVTGAGVRELVRRVHRQLQEMMDT